MTTCQIDNCDNDRRGGGQGYCKKHHIRLLKHGDPHYVGKRRTRAAIEADAAAAATPVERITVDQLPLDLNGRRVTLCAANRDKFDAVYDLKCWQTGSRPTGGAARIIEAALDVCAQCPLSVFERCQSDARREGWDGVVGGEYRPAAAAGVAS